MKNAVFALIFAFGSMFVQYGICADTAFVYPDDLERDPFDPLVDSNGVVNLRLVRAEGDLKINGLVYSDEDMDRMVIINNEVLYENDIIGDYRIQHILPNKVILQRGNKEIELTMEGDDG